MHSFLSIPLAALLLGSPLLLRAQTATPASGWHKSIGLSVTPTLNYRTLSGSDGYVVSTRNDEEKSRVGFDAGATLRLTHGEHLALDAGLSFASRGYRLPTRALVWPDPQGQPQSGRTSYQYQFVSLPVQASYAFGSGRLRGFVGGGVSLDFLLGVRTVNTLTRDGQESTTSANETSGYLRSNITPRLTAGLRYALTPRYSLELAPVVQYSLLGSRIHSSVSEHLYSAGVNVGMYRQF